MTKMQAAMAVPTYRNTTFEKWWHMLNLEMDRFRLPGVAYGDAMGAYEMGESPQTAAANFVALA